MPVTTEDRLFNWAMRKVKKTQLEDQVHALFGTDHDSPMLKTINDLWDAYTVAVGQLVGDQDDWLQYFESECEMGREPREVVLKPGGKPIKLSSLKALERVIKARGSKP
jgi:hypothetical protein